MKNIIKNCSLIFFSLIILELISSIFFLFYGDRRYGFLLKPFSNKIEENIKFTNFRINWDYKTNKMVPGFYEHNGVQYFINSKGFRGKEFKETKDKFRIICFGGSTTIGLASHDDKTYPFLLGKKFKDAGYDFEVLNFGFGSKSLNYIKSLLFTEAFKYKPNIITIYSNRNSTMYDSSHPEYHNFNNNFILVHYYLNENIMTYRFMNKVYKRVSLKFNSQKKIVAPYTNSLIDENYFVYGYKSAISEIINFSKKNSIDVYLIKQAFYINPQITKELENFDIPDLIDKLKNRYLEKKYNISNVDSFWLITSSILNKNLDLFNNISNVKIIDPLDKLLQDKNNFTDYLHLPPQGNNILASEIFKVINKNL